jgi:hypothetical protein
MIRSDRRSWPLAAGLALLAGYVDAPGVQAARGGDVMAGALVEIWLTVSALSSLIIIMIALGLRSITSGHAACDPDKGRA